MEGLGSPSCDSGSYMMPDLCLKGQEDEGIHEFSTRFTKKWEDPIIRRRLYHLRYGLAGHGSPNSSRS